MEYSRITAEMRDNACFIQFKSDNGKNCINSEFTMQLSDALSKFSNECSVIVLEGNDDYFCYGADFEGIGRNVSNGSDEKDNPAELFDLWKQMTEAPCAIISHVKGAVNAGGVGFVSASDIVIASDKATFGLSELLFGLMPAMVMPFLIRRAGYSKAKYLTLTTKPVTAALAYEYGIADIVSEHSDIVMRQTVARLSKTPRDGIARYKQYMNSLCPITEDDKSLAVKANRLVFSDEVNLKRVADFALYGKYPWES